MMEQVRLCAVWPSENWTGKEVEAHVAKGLGLSLFRREEPVDGDSDESYALRSYRSKVTRLPLGLP